MKIRRGRAPRITRLALATVLVSGSGLALAWSGEEAQFGQSGTKLEIGQTKQLTPRVRYRRARPGAKFSQLLAEFKAETANRRQPIPERVKGVRSTPDGVTVASLDVMSTLGVGFLSREANGSEHIACTTLGEALLRGKEDLRSIVRRPANRSGGNQ